MMRVYYLSNRSEQAFWYDVNKELTVSNLISIFNWTSYPTIEEVRIFTQTDEVLLKRSL